MTNEILMAAGAGFRVPDGKNGKPNTETRTPISATKGDKGLPLPVRVLSFCGCDKSIPLSLVHHDIRYDMNLSQA